MQQEHVFYSSVRPEEGTRRFVLPGLDGLRAVAVLLVVIYHLWPAALPGGMIGVDIFFVISGYLITALLLREGAYTGKMNIIAFWVRRLRRLVPAVAALVLTIAPVALLVGGDILVGFGRQLLGAFTYSSNWFSIAAGNDYFTQTSPELLTNFWSLAVEEQFYFFWPVVLVFACIFLKTWRQRALVPVILGVLSLVLVIILVWSGGSFARIYYGTDTHLYGLMLGVLLALLIPWSMYPPVDARLYTHVGYGNGLWGTVRALVGWFSLAAIVPLARVLSEHEQSVLQPWGLLAGALLGLGVLQALLPDTRSAIARWLRGALSFAPLVWIGKRSYGIYLWHWPLAVLAHYIFGPGFGLWVQIPLLLLTLTIAGFSYMYIETPVRRYGFRGALTAWVEAIFSPAKALPVAGVALLVVGAAANVFAVQTAPHMTEAQALIAQGKAQLNRAQQESGSSHVAENQQTTAPDAPSSVSTDSAEIAPEESNSGISIIGDSVSLASAGQLHEKLPDSAVNAEISRQFAAAPDIIFSLKQEGTLGDTLVLSLTTNSTISPTMVDQAITAAKDAGVQHIVLVTGQAPAHLTWVQASNEVLQATAQRHPEVALADWATASTGKPQLFANDGVHPTPEGAELYAQTIKDAVEKVKGR
ncbi:MULTISPECIES: acyltransferase family protein [unclassified Rothia (in: high G+C Gram-positive bacteria)]|uniref:acyltransferase family protein n=1 Tax=unclassified Rothia (in: high G+C Gram-positive bacteria) TaxID=2689056 RepID=UPI00195C3D3D|nr:MULTISPECIES: acyltransferase family protein [unclassified Rothia (in: high G+C Gram-positive bacteria)]MBM7051297.1 acyltransferase [Rothia sp. ZJ1223]QRZ61090.1 acyltransferase [Rothia sp. ZJ932]